MSLTMLRGSVTPSAIALTAALTLGAALAATGAASAGATRADSTVTIRTENGDFWGQVKSPRPAKCAEGRKVVVFKQVGKEQDPSRDERVASDTASLSGDRYEWNTGNTGLTGKFYARVARTEHCRADFSKTVRATKN